jgi:hypothetical protein
VLAVWLVIATAVLLLALTAAAALMWVRLGDLEDLLLLLHARQVDKPPPPLTAEITGRIHVNQGAANRAAIW